MKRALSVIFSLLLIWMQLVVEAAPQAAAERAPQCDCGCAQANCCVAPAAPGSPASAPAVPIRAGVDKQLSLPVANSVAWVLPRAEARPVSTLPLLPHFSAGPPLYEWNCARLI